MTRVICPKCGQPAEAEHIVCLRCGALLFNPALNTVHMRSDPSMLRLRREHPQEEDLTLPEHVVSLHMRGLTEKLSFEDGTQVILGRYDVTASPTPRLDLTHYGARERGVSREHALLHFENDQLTITDLRSVNGTFVNRVRLEPNQSRVIHNGDEISLGTLSIVIKFELSQDTKIITSPDAKHNDDTLHVRGGVKPDTLPETRDLNSIEADENKPLVP